MAGNLNFKLRIVFCNIFFLEIWRFEKQITLSAKNPPLVGMFMDKVKNFCDHSMIL